jgi:hypothetical protein
MLRFEQVCFRSLQHLEYIVLNFVQMFAHSELNLVPMFERSVLNLEPTFAHIVLDLVPTICARSVLDLENLSLHCIRNFVLVFAQNKLCRARDRLL